MRSPLRARLRRKPSKYARFLPLVGDAARLLKTVRDQPRAIDWLSFGLQAVALGVRTRDAVRAQRVRSPWLFFDDDGPESEWVRVEREFESLVLRHVEHPAVEESTWDGESESDRAVLGHVDGHVVGWIQAASDPRVLDGPFVRRGAEGATLAAVGRAIWSSFEERHLSFGAQGLTKDPLVGNTASTARSAQANALLQRIARFRAAGVPRSVLLVGPPGTGKSHAIRSIAQGLELSTLRIELAALLDRQRAHGAEEVQDHLETLVRMLAPEAIVIDDIDRVGTDVRLLRFLEEASAAGRIVLGSANGTSDMLGALLRPGRFDEVVPYEQLDEDVLARMLGEHRDLLKRVQPLPMAYVREFVLRVQVLGRDAALEELASLEKRAAQTRRSDRGR